MSRDLRLWFHNAKIWLGSLVVVAALIGSNNMEPSRFVTLALIWTVGFSLGYLSGGRSHGR